MGALDEDEVRCPRLRCGGILRHAVEHGGQFTEHRCCIMRHLQRWESYSNGFPLWNRQQEIVCDDQEQGSKGGPSTISTCDAEAICTSFGIQEGKCMKLALNVNDAEVYCTSKSPTNGLVPASVTCTPKTKAALMKEAIVPEDQ